MIKLIIQPSDIDYKNGFFSTAWQNSERETIARNIVVLCKRLGNMFIPFSWTTYKKVCNHKVTLSEQRYLDHLVDEGYLTFNKRRQYAINFEFLQVLKKYINAKIFKMQHVLVYFEEE